MSITSYAQNFEDVILWRALGSIPSGYYIDIGAQDPVIDSVSLAFYRKGWRGMHVEPSLGYAEALREARPEETVCAVAVGREPGRIRLHEFERTGLSTGVPELAEAHRRAGHDCRLAEVDVVTLDELLERRGADPIHWLKIDVEGMEGDVLAGWRDAPQRPWIVVVESTRPGSTRSAHEDWEPGLLAKGYRFVYFDGLNRFYLSQAHPELADAFRAPPNVFDDFQLGGKASHAFCNHMKHEVHLVEVEASEFAGQAYRANQQLARLTRELERSRREQETLEQQLRDMRESRSWRITAPMREVGARVRRVRGKARAVTASSARVGAGHPLSRPLGAAARWLSRHPGLRRLVLGVVRRIPNLEERLRARLRRPASPAAERPNRLPDHQDGLTRRARQLHHRLTVLADRQDRAPARPDGANGPAPGQRPASDGTHRQDRR